MVTVFKQIDGEEKSTAGPQLTKVIRRSSMLRRERFAAPKFVRDEEDGGNSLRAVGMRCDESLATKDALRVAILQDLTQYC